MYSCSEGCVRCSSCGEGCVRCSSCSEGCVTCGSLSSEGCVTCSSCSEGCVTCGLCSEGCVRCSSCSVGGGVNPLLYYHPGHCLVKQYLRHQTLPYHQLPSPQCHLYPTPQGLHQPHLQRLWSPLVTNMSLSMSVITSEMVWHGVMCSEWCCVAMVRITW